MGVAKLILDELRKISNIGKEDAKRLTTSQRAIRRSGGLPLDTPSPDISQWLKDETPLDMIEICWGAGGPSTALRRHTVKGVRRTTWPITTWDNGWDINIMSHRDQAD